MPFSLSKIIISLVFLISFYVYISSPLVVTVSGVGEVNVSANNAVVSFSIVTSDDNSQTAILNANAKALALRSFLKSKGIDEKDIAESQVVSVPKTLVKAGDTGYQTTISMGVKTSKVAEASTLISDLYKNGAYFVSQPILSIEDRANFEKTAVDLAIKDAKLKAVGVGSKNWKFIRKVVAVTETPSNPTSVVTTDAGSATGSTFKITKVVTVSYKMW